MSWRDPLNVRSKVILGIALAMTLPASMHVSAADDALESTQLALILRQLDTIDRTADLASASAASNSRYRFDYARLRTDLARVRAGIEDYLAPPRAQPRDPTPLDGEYRTDQAPRQ